MLKFKIEVKDWLDRHDVKNYHINDDLTVDINGEVNLEGRELKEIPIKFNNVTGDFNCKNNKLKNIKFAPNNILGSLVFSSNQVTSLEGCPEIMGESLNCQSNLLESLEGCPKIIGKHFIFSNNKIKNLEIIPDFVGGLCLGAMNADLDFKDGFLDFDYLKEKNRRDKIKKQKEELNILLMSKEENNIINTEINKSKKI